MDALRSAISAPNWELISVTAGSFAGLTALFYASLASGKVPSQRQRSWILTGTSSVVMTAASVPYLWDWIVVGELRHGGGWAEIGCCFFVAYLLADLVLGSLHYRSAITLMTGWFHHIAYTLLLSLLVIPYSFSPIFAMCAVLELPTSLLALGNLVPYMRNDYLFAAVFFLTRIVLHTYIGVSYAVRAMGPAQGSWVPSIVLACVMPMHIFWMRNCIRGILRRRAAAKKAASTIVAAGVVAAATAEVPPAAPVMRPTKIEIPPPPAEPFRMFPLRSPTLTAIRQRLSKVPERLPQLPSPAAAVGVSREEALRMLRDALRTVDNNTRPQPPRGQPQRWRNTARRVVGGLRRQWNASAPGTFDTERTRTVAAY